MPPRYARKTDANQARIVEALRKAGRSVALLHREGGGLPDLVVGNGEENILLEIKVPKGGKLNPLQVEFHETWRGPIATARDEFEAIDLTCPIRGKGLRLAKRLSPPKLQRRLKAPLGS